MAEPKQRPTEVVWEQFSQTANTPVTGKNPVTRVINMELAADKSIKSRAGFSTATGISGTSDIENQIVTSLLNHANTVLVYKQGDEIKWWDGSNSREYQSLTLDNVHYGKINTNTPCSFSVYGGELYVCESQQADPSESALFAWDGSTVRNLGVPALSGEIPKEDASGNSIVSICSAQNFQEGWEGCGWGCQVTGQGHIDYTVLLGSDCDTGDDATVTEIDHTDPIDCDGTIYLCEGANPGFVGRFCWAIPASGCENSRGEKILNCSFRVGLYDPKRNIFGRATKPRAVINFGPDRGRYGMFQYQILCDKPNADIPAGYKLAVWCSTPVEVMTVGTYNQTGNLTIGGKRHAMSEHLGGQTFLEGIFNTSGGGNSETPNCAGLCLYKDQMLLANSKPYNHTFDRPVPSKAMCVIGNIALYFNPIASGDGDPIDDTLTSTWDAYSTSQYENLGGEAYRYGVEFSVGHPEQIGRYSDIAETFTALPHLKGDVVSVFNDSGNNMLLTRQGLYSIGFSGGAQIQDLGGPGILSSKTFHPTSSGVMYVADEGPIWLQGGKPVAILRTLGFDGWIDELTDDEKKEIRIGFIEDSKKVLCHLPVPGSNGKYRYLMHDVESSFTSEWWVGSSQDVDEDGTSMRGKTMSSFRSDFGYRFLLWHDSGVYRYNDTSQALLHDNYVPMVEMWVNENSNYTKQLNTVTVDFGKCNDDVIVSVETFDNPLQKTNTGGEGSTDSRQVTLGKTDREQRTIISYFMGMRGKFIRIRVYQNASTNSRMQIMRVHASVQYDDNPMTIGETIMDGLAP